MQRRMLLKLMSTYHPIGIFDSGVGGLSIAKSIREQLPNESLLYVADSYHAPYGSKSPAFITQRARAISKFLSSNDAKAIIVACNTATVSGISELRKEFSIPVIGVEPGIKPATLITKNGVIGVLATPQTVNSYTFQNLLKRFTHSNIIVIQSCPELAEQVEMLELSSHKTRQLLQKYLKPLLDKGIDTLVLGCTHYGFLTPMIESIIGPKVTIINTDKPVARQVKRRLETENLLSSNIITDSPIDMFWSSDCAVNASRVISQLWGTPIQVSAFPSGPPPQILC